MQYRNEYKEKFHSNNQLYLCQVKSPQIPSDKYACRIQMIY